MSDSTIPSERPLILGTGLLALDVIVGADPKGTATLAAGGTCGNVLTVLSSLGWDALPIARFNGDAASRWLRKDLERWGVSLRFVDRTPGAPTPIIVQRNRNDATHRFSMTCPECGTWFPRFRPVTQEATKGIVTDLLDRTSAGLRPEVFFFDRVSRSSLLLAEASAACGAIVVFEPTSIGNPRLFAEALSYTRILKYSGTQLRDLATRDLRDDGLWLEIETQGSNGFRYRAREFSGTRWHHVPAISIARIADTSGAGDWFIAAVLDCLGRLGADGLEKVDRDSLQEALSFARTLAAFACEYEGARGAMCATEEGAFTKEFRTSISVADSCHPLQAPCSEATKPLKSLLNVLCSGCAGQGGALS